MCRHNCWGALKTGTFLLFGILIGCADSPVKESARLDQQDSLEAVQIKAQLLEASDLAGAPIDVDVEGDKAILDGFVETPQQRDRAEAIAREHQKVKTVENNIQVK